MPNSFTKQDYVNFKELILGFQDALVMSGAVVYYSTDGEKMARANDITWRPMPYIAQSFSGTDATSNFKTSTQLSVPASLGFEKHSTWLLTAKEYRDSIQEGRLRQAAMQKLASDINKSIMDVAANEGTLVVKRAAAATGFNDVAECEAVMNEIGVPSHDRNLVLSTRDYNGMASDLAGRQTMHGKPASAYEKAYVGPVASFDTFKLDYHNRLAVAAGVTVTINGANQYYTPKATSTASTGETANVDNRYQNITIAVSSGTVKVGDAFKIAGVNSVHMITKVDTGQSKTYRIKAIVSGAGGSGVVTISPPIISAQGATDAELQYKNCTATPANGAAITFLNTASAPANVFWQKDALEILPGRYEVPTDSGAAVMRATTDNGVDVVWQKQYDIKTMNTYNRIDVLYGVVNKQPEMSGIMLFAQP